MINVYDEYLTANDKINSEENGNFSFELFNRFSWIAQLNLQDWLSGDVAGVQPPEMYQNLKDRAYLSQFITKYPKQVVAGVIEKPTDYYLWDNGYLLGNYNNAPECDTDETEDADNCNIPIELLTGDVFYSRCNTLIEGLQPSFTKPICKEIGTQFEFLPKDLGSVTIEYIRYPVRAVLGTKWDEQFHQFVYDPTTSVNFEWPPFAEDILAWFIADQFSNRTREQALKQFNAATGKTPRG